VGETCQGFPEGMPVAGEPGRVCEGDGETERLSDWERG